ncbi:MAG: alkaline phosphatase D family protein [Dongiaceae bacterium]
MPLIAASRRVSRRKLLRIGGVALAAGLAAPWIRNTAFGMSSLGNTMRLPIWRGTNPFSLGVAAGEPSGDGFVLWTRLAPDPLSADPAAPGGIAAATGDIEIAYEIAEDPDLRVIRRGGTVLAEAAYGYSVHLELGGLDPNRPYWYRFNSGGMESRIGKAVTAPAGGQSLDRLRLGVVSCSNYERGYFSAYRHLTDEQPDLVLFLGDYIYEKVMHGGNAAHALRHHSDGVAAATLPHYRNRYAQYRLDPDLQRLHAELPALITWDDHEVQNDYAGIWSETFDHPADFLLRRAAAYRAFYEHMPLRPSRALPQGPDMRLYGRFDFGDLAQISMLDGRQYRSREACYGPPDRGGGHQVNAGDCPELDAADRSMLGGAQEQWLYDGMATSRARWNILAQDVLMAPFRQRQPAPEHDFAVSTDRWDGYPANRARLLRRIHETQLSNPVVLGGDIHSFWTTDLHLDPADETSPVVASEFVGTSVTSPGPDYDSMMRDMNSNPHVRFFDSRQRGYLSLDLTPAALTARLQVISDVRDPQATLATLKTFVIENGRTGAVTA